MLASHYHGVWSMAIHALKTFTFLDDGKWNFSSMVTFIKKLKINLKFLSSFNTILKNNYGFDDFNEKYLAHGILKLGHFLSSKIDIKVIDHTLVNGAGRLVSYFSNKLKSIQSGYIYHYAFFMIIGLFLFITFFLRT